MTKTSGKMQNRRLGRPRVAPEEARRNRVVTMVTDDEMATLQKSAAAKGKSISAFVHEVLAVALFRQS